MRFRKSILWITDLHLKKEYDKNKEVQDLIDSFLKFIKNEIITHIVISGDITYHGDKDEFNVFKDAFYERLKENYKNALFIIIPGNHEVEWLKAKKTFKKHHNISEADVKNYKFYRIINKEDFKDYKKNFSNFIDFSNDYLKINCNIQKKLIDNLFGYYYDQQFNVLFIVINSCWFSFGHIKEKKFKIKLKELNNFKKSKKTDKNINILGNKNSFHQILEIDGSFIQEYGNQTYGLNLFKEYDLWKDIDSNINEDTIVVSLAHHPVDCLHWDEIFPKYLGKPLEINNLFQRSHFHLVGHDHCYSDGILYYDHCYQLRNGLFLEAISSQNNSLLLNTFSIIKINNKFASHHLYCRAVESIGELKWKELKEDKYVIKPKKFSDNELTSVENKIKTTNIENCYPEFFNIKKYIQNKNIICNSCDINELKKLNDGAIYYIIKNNDFVRFIFLTLNAMIDNKNNISENFVKVVMDEINNISIKSNNIIISIIDSYNYEPAHSSEIQFNTKLINEVEKKLGDFDRKCEYKYQVAKHQFFTFVKEKYPEFFNKIYDMKFTYDLCSNKDAIFTKD